VRTLDRIAVRAPLDRVFRVAAEVERWPAFLDHYRYVRMLERRTGGGLVEMAAWRRFGPLPYPTWWVSEMEVVWERHVVRYRHVRGITSGMDVEWRLDERAGAVDVTIEHVWRGPAWPLIGAAAANLVIGPVFIHHIASHTLAGVKREAEGS
jgi:uncharacterized membrane protein